MAWRPTEYVIEGELDNTTPGKVTGWIRFAGMTDRMTFDLQGNFHRDIRGAKIRFTGDGQHADPAAREYLEGMADHQTGQAGDITAGLPPHDYGNLPYVEWYGDENGRVVVEPDVDCIEVIGRPIPACENDPISREVQRENMARFVERLSHAVSMMRAVPHEDQPSDSTFSHWVVTNGQVIGEARDVESGEDSACYAYVRLFNLADCAEYGMIERSHLLAKITPPRSFGI
jgi:hypothetical protein